jgi:acetylornithine deacetylase/succinyl-diaminopimelate desuccinylase-like protein
MTSVDGHQARPLRWRVRNQPGRFVLRFDVDDAVLPGRNPKRIIALIRKHLKAICPPTVKPTITQGQSGGPYLVDPIVPLVQACTRAAKAGFAQECKPVHGGGSIPIIAALKQHWKSEALMPGLAPPDEKFSLDAYMTGMRMGACLWPELAAAA